MMSDGLKFSSGRELYANCGIIGIDAEGEISGGYDQGISFPPSGYDRPQLSRADWLELADMMLERWRQFRLKAQALPADDHHVVIRYENGVPIYGYGTGDLDDAQAGELR